MQLLISHKRMSSDSQIAKLTDSTFQVVDGATGRRHAVKVINANEGRGTHGIKETWRRTEEVGELVQPVTDLLEFDGYVVALLDWIDGKSLKETNREMLPSFFSRLRCWHSTNEGAAQIYSPYTETEYGSIEEFIDAEVSLHLNSAKLQRVRRQGLEAVSGLHHGFVTLIHGDVHPGNILYTHNRFKLLDPEYVHCSINVLDLDYIDYGTTPAGDSRWWDITKWANECASAYFAIDQYAVDRISEIMHSVRILSSLRSITNTLVYRTGNTGNAIERFRSDLCSVK